MKLPIQFFIIGILFLTFTGCNLQSSTIGKFENAKLSNDLFSWQQEEYCSFEDKLLISEIRCSFEFNLYSENSHKDPYWTIRHYDKEFTDDLEVSGMHLIMDLNRRHTFPINKEEAEKYLAESMQFYPEIPEYTIESLSIDGKKAWKIIKYNDGDLDIPLPSGEKRHFSSVTGEYLLEKDDESIYLISVSLLSDSPEKVVAYQAEVDHFISSLTWK